MIPGSGRSPGEGVGYPVQYSWASLVAETVKNPPAMWETWIQPLGWEDPLEKGKTIHSSILAWSIILEYIVHGVAKSQIRLRDFTLMLFPDSSVGKESASNAGDPGSIPGSGRSPGEGVGHPLQYFCASLVVQLVKNLPAMQETPV